MLFLNALAAALAVAAVGLSSPTLTDELVALERRAFEGWARGDPDPNLAILDDQVTYIDSGIGDRLEGVAAVKRFFDAYRGKPLFDSYEFVAPATYRRGDVAVLNYRLIMRTGKETAVYQATEVYERRSGTWRIVHSHFSRVKQS